MNGTEEKQAPSASRDSLTGAKIEGGRYKAYILYFDVRAGAYREGFFSSYANLNIWLARIREGESSIDIDNEEENVIGSSGIKQW